MNSDVDNKIDDNTNTTINNTPFLNVMATRDDLVTPGLNRVINNIVKAWINQLSNSILAMLWHVFSSYAVMTKSRKLG